MAQVCVLLANGFEEIEAVTIIDVLRRANVAVKTLALGDVRVKGAHGMELIADDQLDAGLSKDWDMVILPGGQPGADTLRDDPRVGALLEKQAGAADKGRYLAAICAAPIALGKIGLLKGHRVACYPGYENQLTGAEVVMERVVIDGHLITSRGPGTAFEFAFELVNILKGRSESESLRQGMLVRV